MAIRQIRTKGDDVLYKRCKPVKNFDKKLHVLLDDMYETMQKHEGVGLAAPQVGILKCAIVIDVGEGLVELVNPEICETRGSSNAAEGCLSVPGVFGEVERPEFVSVRAQDRDGKRFMLEAEDVLARAICHECEHLEGRLFLERVTKYVDPE